MASWSAQKGAVASTDLNGKCLESSAGCSAPHSAIAKSSAALLKDPKRSFRMKDFGQAVVDSLITLRS